MTPPARPPADREMARLRQRKCRALKQSGKRRVVLWIDDALVDDLLLLTGNLASVDVDNPTKVHAAFGAAVEALAKKEIAMALAQRMSRVTTRSVEMCDGRGSGREVLASNLIRKAEYNTHE